MWISVTILNSATVVSPVLDSGTASGHHCVHQAPWGSVSHCRSFGVVPTLVGIAATWAGHGCPLGTDVPSVGYPSGCLRYPRWMVNTADGLSNSHDIPSLACWQNLPPPVETEHSRFLSFSSPLHLWHEPLTQPWWLQPDRMSALVTKKDSLCNKIGMPGRKWDCGNPHGTAQGKSKDGVHVVRTPLQKESGSWWQCCVTEPNLQIATSWFLVMFNDKICASNFIELYSVPSPKTWLHGGGR